jgi:beta-aspartyl-dipeptidase (metallo-type)
VTPPSPILIRDADLYAPEALGRMDVLIVAGRIVALGSDLPALPAAYGAEEVDLEGHRVAPGLIDAHVHVIGGGGESGPETRVPPIALSALTRAGVTSVVGVLGTDGTTRTPRDLVARTYGLRAEGLSAWCWTGSYEVPPPTLTGSVRSDIVYVDPVIGVGELALSDHRSSQPTLDELLRVAADCHVGGLMTGKAGILHLHLGHGPRGLSLVREALDVAEIPARVFHPTHVNRRRALFEEAMALADRGCSVDVTAFDAGDDGLSADEAIATWLSSGRPTSKITCSSDGAGCLPVFDADGRMVEMDVGRPSALGEVLRGLLGRGLALSDALLPFTANVADLLRLPGKGRLAVGADADLVVLDEAGAIADVMARGRWMVRAGAPVVKGPFEKATQT